MIDSAAIGEIIAVYVKHGWILRRVLLSAGLKKALGPGRSQFGNVPVIDSDIDAAWFSRPPVPGGVPWEIRHLSHAPYALLENIDEAADDFESRLAAVEDRLRNAAAAKKPA